MYEGGNQSDKRIDERIVLSLPCDNTVEDRLYNKPVKLSYSYSDECFEANRQSSDDSDRLSSQITPVSLLSFAYFVK